MVCLINALCLGDQTIPPWIPLSTLFNGETYEAIIRDIYLWVFFLFSSPHSCPFLTSYLVLLQAYWEHLGMSRVLTGAKEELHICQTIYSETWHCLCSTYHKEKSQGTHLVFQHVLNIVNNSFEIYTAT